MTFISSERLVHGALIVTFTVLAYAGSFSGGWISDDTTGIVGNPLLRSLAPANLRKIAVEGGDHVNYNPLYTLSLAVDHQFWGDKPPGYHATNLAIHCANALLVYGILVRMREAPGLALVVALLWALHPVQVESVAWISERKNVLSTLFFFLAFFIYLRFSDRPRARTYGLLLALFGAALLSKVNTIVLPAITLAYEVTARFRLRTRDLLATVPMLALGAWVAWMNLAGNPSHGVAYHGGSLWVTLRTSSTVVLRYLGLVVAPTDTSHYHAVPLRASWLDPGVLASVLVIVALAAVALYLVARRRAGAFWIVWFVVTLSPMLNLVPFPALMADRYLYIPILGPLVLLAHGAYAVAGWSPSWRWAMRGVGAIAVAACAWLTVTRVPVFREELSLWADWAVRVPYLSADQPYGAAPRPRQIQILRDALARNPDSAVLHNNLGAIAFEERRLTVALEELTRARALDPDDPHIALNLGRAYLWANRPADAAGTLEHAVRLEPPSYFALLNLGRAYLQLGAPARAREPLARARSQRPSWSDGQREWARLETMEREASRARAP